MKKKFFVLILGSLINWTTAQISIGGKQNVEGTSTIMDFNSTAANTSGIILPAVENVNNSLSALPSTNNGTFVFDKSTNKIRMYENNTWKDLTDTGNSSSLIANSSDETGGDQGVIIGSENSGAKGILILESTDKALILPKIQNPHITVKSPYPGMICYDAASKSLAVFDGNVWSYWK
jgi:hypothetical protein